MASYSSSFSQEQFDSECNFNIPEDTTGIKFENINYTPEEFPDWHLSPFELKGKRKYGYLLGNKMEITIDSTAFINYYTEDAGSGFSGLNGIDNKSMMEFAKEKYRKSVLEEFLKTVGPAPLGCHEGRDYYVFSFITKKSCTKKSQCRIKMSPYSCCSDDTMNVVRSLSNEFNVIIENGQKYLIVTKDVICSERACCEERFHYVCNPNATNPNSTWQFHYKDFAEYPYTGCPPNTFINPNCQFYPPSSCKSGCGN